MDRGQIGIVTRPRDEVGASEVARREAVEGDGVATVGDRDEPSVPTDAQRRLVERATVGDREAFAELYRAHLAVVYRFVRFHVSDPEAAADVTQDTFVSAWRGIHDLRDPGSFRLWLLRGAYRHVLNFRRSSRRRPFPVPLSVADAAARGAGEDPASGVEAAMTVDEVLRAAATLTPLQQQVFALRFVAGLSVAETAAMTGRSAGAVRNLQFHAVAALRRTLAGEEGP